MTLKLIVVIAVVVIVLGCTDEASWTDGFDVTRLYEVTVYGSQNTTYGTPHQRNSLKHPKITLQTERYIKVNEHIKSIGRTTPKKL